MYRALSVLIVGFVLASAQGNAAAVAPGPVVSSPNQAFALTPTSAGQLQSVTPPSASLPPWHVGDRFTYLVRVLIQSADDSGRVTSNKAIGNQEQSIVVLSDKGDGTFTLQLNARSSKTVQAPFQDTFKPTLENLILFLNGSSTNGFDVPATELGGSGQPFLLQARKIWPARLRNRGEIESLLTKMGYQGNGSYPFAGQSMSYKNFGFWSGSKADYYYHVGLKTSLSMPVSGFIGMGYMVRDEAIAGPGNRLNITFTELPGKNAPIKNR